MNGQSNAFHHPPRRPRVGALYLRTIPEEEASKGEDDVSVSAISLGNAPPKSLKGWWHVILGRGGVDSDYRSEAGDSTRAVEGNGGDDSEVSSTDGEGSSSEEGDRYPTDSFGGGDDDDNVGFGGAKGRPCGECAARRYTPRCSTAAAVHGLLCLSTLFAVVVGISVYIIFIPANGGDVSILATAGEQQQGAAPQPPATIISGSPTSSPISAPLPLDDVPATMDINNEEVVEVEIGQDREDAASPEVLHPPPTPNPTISEHLAYSLFAEVSGSEETVWDPTTPQGQAAAWMLRHDGLRLVPRLLRKNQRHNPRPEGGRGGSEGDDNRVSRRRYLQRYVLAVLHLGLSVDNKQEGLSKSGPNNRDGAVLTAPVRSVGRSGGGGEMKDEEDWLSPTHECRWLGVTCASMPVVDDITGKYTSEDEDAVSNLVLSGLGLTGTLPNELAELSSLHELMMYDNTLFGTIPSRLTSMRELYYLDLGNNLLSGAVPPLSPTLEYVYLNNNMLSGQLPVPYPGGSRASGGPYALKHLWLDRNELIGEIPDAFLQYEELRSFIVYNNSLSSTLPEAISNLTKLQYLDVSYNTLSGTLPEALYTLQSLRSLYLSSNKFKGKIKSQIKGLTKLQYLWIDNNNFKKSIPLSLSKLTQLKSLLLQSNRFEGGVPGNICSMVEAGKLQVLEADCGDASRDVFVNCSCCTACH